MAKTVLFIHGMFMNVLCWEKWIPRFKASGKESRAILEVS